MQDMAECPRRDSSRDSSNCSDEHAEPLDAPRERYHGRAFLTEETFPMNRIATP